MAYIRDTEEFDPATRHILGEALDEAWRRVRRNHLNGSAHGARAVLAQYIFATSRLGWGSTSVSLIAAPHKRPPVQAKDEIEGVIAAQARDPGSDLVVIIALAAR